MIFNCFCDIPIDDAQMRDWNSNKLYLWGLHTYISLLKQNDIEKKSE